VVANLSKALNESELARVHPLVSRLRKARTRGIGYCLYPIRFCEPDSLPESEVECVPKVTARATTKREPKTKKGFSPEGPTVPGGAEGTMRD